MNREQRRRAAHRGHQIKEFRPGWYDCQYPGGDYQHIVCHDGIGMTMTEREYQGFLTCMDMLEHAFGTAR